MFCPHCGKEILPDAKFCDNCGAQVADKDVIDKGQPSTEKSTYQFSTQITNIVNNKELFKYLAIGATILALILIFTLPLFIEDHGIGIKFPESISLFNLSNWINDWKIAIDKTGYLVGSATYTYQESVPARFAIFLGKLLSFVLGVSVVLLFISMALFVKFKRLIFQLGGTIFYIVSSLLILVVANTLTLDEVSFSIVWYIITAILIFSSAFIKFYSNESFSNIIKNDYKDVKFKAIKLKSKFRR